MSKAMEQVLRAHKEGERLLTVSATKDCSLTDLLELAHLLFDQGWEVVITLPEPIRVKQVSENAWHVCL